MIGLFLSEVILFVAVGLIGFAAGWRVYAAASATRRLAEQRHVEHLRSALSDAQVHRARRP
jgi:hypothetical protein